MLAGPIMVTLPNKNSVTKLNLGGDDVCDSGSFCTMEQELATRVSQIVGTMMFGTEKNKKHRLHVVLHAEGPDQESRIDASRRWRTAWFWTLPCSTRSMQF